MKALKIGCLSCALIFAILIIVYFIGTYNAMNSAIDSSVEHTPFEVMTKKGMVKLHLGMPKDSVIIIIGEPDYFNSYSMGNTIIEEIGYKINNKDYEDLTFHFENGELESFRQN